MIQNQNPVPQFENTQIRIFPSRFLVKNKKMTQVSLGRKGASCWQGFGELTVLQKQAQTRTRQGKALPRSYNRTALPAGMLLAPLLQLRLHHCCGHSPPSTQALAHTYHQLDAHQPVQLPPPVNRGKLQNSELLRIMSPTRWPEVGLGTSVSLGLQHREAESSFPFALVYHNKKKTGHKKDRHLPQKSL